jgi:hypothetical protein
MKPWIDDAVQRYDRNPSTALMVVAIRHGFWMAPKWESRALAALQQARADMAKGAA